MALNVTENQSLYKIRDLINPIADINFFIELGDSGENYSDDELASIIQAKKYDKTKKEVANFARRKMDALESKRDTVRERKAEYEATDEAVNKNTPGRPPSEFWVNESDPDSVQRYNREAQEHRNRVALYKDLISQRDRAKERYEDASHQLRDREEEVREQIREQEEKLKPALDEDMATFMGKLQQLVYDQYHNKALVFESFVLIFMAKKAYMFLYDRIESGSDRDRANQAFARLNEQLERIVNDHSDELKHNYTEILTYIYDCFQDNEAIFSALEEQLEQLPYPICSANRDNATALTSLPIETNFEYREIIDPRELSTVAVRIENRHEQFKNSIAEIDTFLNCHAATFDFISEILADSRVKLQSIRKNKQDRLGEAFDYSRFVLGVFNEEIQDEYLKQHKALLELMQEEIEASLSVNLTQLIKAILETELMCRPAARAIDNNEAFDFLFYRDQLYSKRQEFVSALPVLERQLQEISKQPKEKAEIFSQELQKLLQFSVLPIGNLGTLFPIHKTITNFVPALGSGHPVYEELREDSKNKLQKFLITHVIVAVIVGGGAFALTEAQRTLALGVAGTYGASAGTLFLKKKQVTAL